MREWIDDILAAISLVAFFVASFVAADVLVIMLKG